MSWWYNPWLTAMQVKEKHSALFQRERSELPGKKKERDANNKIKSKRTEVSHRVKNLMNTK